MSDHFKGYISDVRITSFARYPTQYKPSLLFRLKLALKTWWRKLWH